VIRKKPGCGLKPWAKSPEEAAWALRVPVGGERCNQTKRLPVALVRIIASSYNTHTWHAFDLVDKLSRLQLTISGRRYRRPLEPRRPPVETTARLTFWQSPKGLFRKGSPQGLYHHEPEPEGPEPALAAFIRARRLVGSLWRSLSPAGPEPTGTFTTAARPIVCYCRGFILSYARVGK
jgi:hypothetical protein